MTNIKLSFEKKDVRNFWENLDELRNYAPGGHINFYVDPMMSPTILSQLSGNSKLYELFDHETNVARNLWKGFETGLANHLFDVYMNEVELANDLKIIDSRTVELKESLKDIFEKRGNMYGPETKYKYLGKYLI